VAKVVYRRASRDGGATSRQIRDAVGRDRDVCEAAINHARGAGWIVGTGRAADPFRPGPSQPGEEG
jgi:hypothetical protein